MSESSVRHPDFILLIESIPGKGQRPLQYKKPVKGQSVPTPDSMYELWPHGHGQTHYRVRDVVRVANEATKVVRFLPMPEADVERLGRTHGWLYDPAFRVAERNNAS